MALSGDCFASRNYRSAGIKCLKMIHVALTDAAYDAIAATLQGRGTVAHATRSGPMLHPSRGGGDRPHEDHAQARGELQPRHLAARRTGGQRSKINRETIQALVGALA
jgi:hypothetical protein